MSTQLILIEYNSLYIITIYNNNCLFVHFKKVKPLVNVANISFIKEK